MKTYTIDHGLLMDGSTTPPTCCGYIFNFEGHGAFEPDGKLQVSDGLGGARDASQGEIDEHNRLLAQAELEAIKKAGKGVLYLRRNKTNGTYEVGTWAEEGGRAACHYAKKSRHNIAEERLDVWFSLGGARWHGVNIGDNDIVRVKRVTPDLITD